jgi:hypothetical protein
MADDGKGGKRFVSLLDSVPADDRQFRDVWRILPSKEGAYFSSYQRIFLLQSNGKIRVWRPRTTFGNAFLVDNHLYCSTDEDGLVRLGTNGIEKLPGGEDFKRGGVTAFLADGTTTLLASAQSLQTNAGRGSLPIRPTRLFKFSRGVLQPFPTGADAFFAKNSVYSMARLPGDVLAIGTRLGGMVLLDADGKLRRTVRESDGLPDNFVTQIEPDRQGKRLTNT